MLVKTFKILKPAKEIFTSEKNLLLQSVNPSEKVY